MSAFIFTRIQVGDYATWRPMFDQDLPPVVPSFLLVKSGDGRSRGLTSDHAVAAARLAANAE